MRTMNRERLHIFEPVLDTPVGGQDSTPALSTCKSMRVGAVQPVAVGSLGAKTGIGAQKYDGVPIFNLVRVEDSMQRHPIIR